MGLRLASRDGVRSPDHCAPRHAPAEWRLAWVSRPEGGTPVTAFIRLLGFVPPAGALADQRLREVILPGLQGQPGLRYVWAGRSAGDGGPRLVVSVWEVESSEGQPPTELVELFGFEQASELGDATLEVLPVEVALPVESPDEPRIMRVFRGRARHGQLGSYLDALKEAFAAMPAEQRPVALFAAASAPGDVAVVSIWKAWENIEAGAGGPEASGQVGKRLASRSAIHYELVPR